MLKYIIIIALAITFSSCSEKKVIDINSIDITQSSITAEGGQNKVVAEIKIQGMMCESACVSKVNKELVELDCVKNVEMDFDADRDIDIAKVEFDDKNCDAKKLIEKIHSIGDGMYEVKSVEVIQYK